MSPFGNRRRWARSAPGSRPGARAAVFGSIGPTGKMVLEEVEFDPRFHEAVAHHEDPGVTVPTVSEELQPGYLMHDRLLRPSVVKVAMPPEGTRDASANSH